MSEEPLDSPFEPEAPTVKSQGGHTLVGYNERPDVGIVETANEWVNLEQAVNYEDMSAKEQFARQKVADVFIGDIRSEKSLAPNDPTYKGSPEAIMDLEAYLEVAWQGNLFGSVLVKREGRDELVELDPIYGSLKQIVESARASDSNMEQIQKGVEAVNAIEDWAKSQLESGYEFVKIDPRRSGDIYIVVLKDGQEHHLIANNLRRERGHAIGQPWAQAEVPALAENPDDYKFKLGEEINVFTDPDTGAFKKLKIGPAKRVDGGEINYEIIDDGGNHTEAKGSELDKQVVGVRKPFEVGQKWQIIGPAAGGRKIWEIRSVAQRAGGGNYIEAVSSAGEHIQHVPEENLKMMLERAHEIGRGSTVTTEAINNEMADTIELPQDDNAAAPELEIDAEQINNQKEYSENIARLEAKQKALSWYTRTKKQFEGLSKGKKAVVMATGVLFSWNVLFFPVVAGGSTFLLQGAKHRINQWGIKKRLERLKRKQEKVKDG